MYSHWCTDFEFFYRNTCIKIVNICEQLLKTTRGMVWKHAHVDTGAFYTNKEVDHLISEVEVSTLYTMKNYAMTYLELVKLWQTVSFSYQKLKNPLHFWPNKISNEDLLRQCNQESMATILIRRRLKGIGHVIRRDQNSITKTALHWTPEGKCKRRRPKNTWRRTVGWELKSMNNSWGTIEKMAKDRQKWRTFVAALHANGIPGSKKKKKKQWKESIAGFRVSEAMSRWVESITGLRVSETNCE